MWPQYLIFGVENVGNLDDFEETISNFNGFEETIDNGKTLPSHLLEADYSIFTRMFDRSTSPLILAFCTVYFV